MLILERKERGDLDLHFHQSISPLSEGNLLDLDLGIHLLISYLFFLSYSSIALVVVVGFGREGLEHLLFLPLHLVYWFEFSTRIRGSESCELVTLVS